MPKLSFAEVCERLNDQRYVPAENVLQRALQRKVWIAEWHLPGCLSESWSVCLTKREAIETACGFAETADGAPRGMPTSLRKHGRFDSRSPMFGTCVNTIEQRTLGSLL
jgi:hypothetical protein